MKPQADAGIALVSELGVLGIGVNMQCVDADGEIIRPAAGTKIKPFIMQLYVHKTTSEALGSSRAERRKIASASRRMMPNDTDTTCIMSFSASNIRNFIGALLDKETYNYPLEAEVAKLCHPSQPARGMMIRMRHIYLLGDSMIATAGAEWSNMKQTAREIAERREVYDLMGLTADVPSVRFVVDDFLTTLPDFSKLLHGALPRK